jgi:hypothetical protein
VPRTVWESAVPFAPDLDPTSLLIIMQALKDDPEVEIVRVKSSMTKSGLKPCISTGFRFISLNLRIATPQTHRLVMFASPLPSFLWVICCTARGLCYRHFTIKNGGKEACSQC